MKYTVINFDNEKVEEIDLLESVFGLPLRKDILSRMINYQRAKKQSGNHKTKGISEVSGTTKKPWKQKGTGRARAGSLRAPQMRGGGIVFGPVVRKHSHSLPKKIRKLALKTALSVKAQSKSLIIIDNLDFSLLKTKEMASKLKKIGINSALFIGGNEIPSSFSRSISNIPRIDVLPQQGINVFDILRRENLVLSRDALACLEGRLI